MALFDLPEVLTDEIALEGLDGITLQALWLRLAQRFNNPSLCTEDFKNEVWSVCVNLPEVTFYKLKVPRKPLVIYDRYEFVDPDLGIILEPDNIPEDIYPFVPINDPIAGVKGSCSTYKTRKVITDDIKSYTLEEVTRKYDQTLVIVASQATRVKALLADKSSFILKLSIMHYCFLEKVGRSRYHGEVTQGKLSLSSLKEDHRTLFYHRKFLLRHKLITKQTHHQKTAGHSGTGSLLHLPRFFVERKPKMMFLAEQVIEILKTKKDYIAEYEEIKKKLQIENSIQKLVKTSFFQKAVKTDVKVPYRTLYPNAEPKEWQRKSDPSKEKIIRVVQLINPDVDVAELLNKDEIHEDEEQIDVDIQKHQVFSSFLKEANIMNEGSSINGVTQGSLSKDMGLTKLQSRTILRNLVKMNIVAIYMNDAGRQRVTKYVCKKFEEKSTMSKQFQKEVRRIKELTKQMSNKRNEVIPKENEVIPKENEVIPKENEVIPKENDLQKKEIREISDFYTHLIKTIEKLDYQATIDNNTTKYSHFGLQESFINTSKLNSVFRIVNKIFWKYRITKSRTRYKCTFLNVSRTTAKIKLLTDEIINKKSTQNEENIGKTSDNSIEISTVKSTITDNIKDLSMYKSIKTNLVTQNPMRRGKPINETFGFMEDVENREKKGVSNITYRLLKRANMIIESVKEHQVIDDMTKLMKMINDEEDKEGYDVKIDKKSLIRLLDKLAKDNLVKNIKLTLSANGKEKHLTFVCDPNIDTDHTVIKSAIEQAKVKFCLLGSSKSKTNPKNNVDKTPRNNTENTKKRPKILSAIPNTSKYDPKAARKLGYSPKFVRMQELHFLIYYLVYEHPGEDTLSKNEQIKLLRANDFSITDSLAQEMSKIYTTEVGWKMFLPSLPQHNGWPKGWTLMCDILLRIPLSIFLKIHSVPFIISGLEYYTNHPIRKHYLVKDLPMNIQSTLLHGRKYIFDVHETVTRLCYLGLVQFGPQKLKEKDQVFLYVNRHSELMDTTSSAPGYHKVEEKTYPITKYNFNEMYIVEKYWYDMWNICVNTPLGGRLAVQGKDILLEDLSKKSDMIETIKARTAEEAIKLDTGKVPGDRKGAAGIDSAFFAHLKRNWNWNNNITTRNQLKKDPGNKTTCKRDAYLSTIKAAPIKFTEFSGLKKVSGPTTVNSTSMKTKSQSNKVNEVNNKSIKPETYTISHRSKQKSFIRRVLPKKGRKSRVKYDEIDYRALQLMHKLRVDWKPHEDNILLICKVAMMYLCPNHRKQVVSFNMVRDVLRSYSLSSNNKTSRACQRRLLYMLRQPQTVKSVALGVEEIKQNFFLNKRFSGITEKIKQESPNQGTFEKRIAEVFKDLVNYVAKKYYNISEMGSSEPIVVPKTVQEFNIFYKIIYPTKSFNLGYFNDIRCIYDIRSATINSVIHSSMCSGKDKKSWAYQLFKIYQQYPEGLLKSAMAKIRADQLVTIKKNDMHLTKKYVNYMPMSSAQYQFSTSYIYKFQDRWPYDLYMESYNAFFKLIQWYSTTKISNPLTDNVSSGGIEIIPATGGIVAMIHDFMPMDKLDFDVAIPDQVITLDQSLKEKNETYFRIAQRYKDILDGLDGLDGLDYFKDNSNKKTNSIENDKTSIFKKETIVDHRTGNGSSIFEEDVDDEFRSKKARKVDNPDYNFGLQLIEESNSINSHDETKTMLNKTDKEQLKGNHLKRKYIDNCEIDSTESTSKKAKMDDDSECSKLNSCNDTSRSNMETHLNKCLNDFDEKMDNAEISLKSRLLDENSVGCSKSAEDEDIKQKSESQSNEEYNKKTNDNAFTRISSIICSKSKDITYANSYTKLDDTNDGQKQFTRLALLKIREELNEFSVSDSHHAHEYFVVNIFKIFYYLESSSSQHCDEDYEMFKSYALPSGMLPLKLKTVSEIINELNKFATFPKNNTSYANFKKTMNGKVLYNWMKIDAIYRFVKEKKEIGASSEELMQKFRKDFGRELYDIVSLLIDNYLFLRSGVTTPRYIHYGHVNPWLVHSYKIFRSDRESLLPIPKDSIYLTENQTVTDTNIDDIKKDNDIGHNKDSLESSICEDITMIDNEEKIRKKDTMPSIGNGTEEQENATIISNSGETEKEPNVCATKRLQRKRISLLPQKDIFTSAKKLDLTNAEEIKVVMKPWIRVDGVLNRRVLDRMLGAVLTYCLTHPGVTLVKVQNRFSPALQPFHTRELIEILIKLGCLEKKILIKQHVTLFSKPAPVKPKTDEEWVSEEEIFIEPLMGAIIKFGIFLSTKMYNSDYIP
ncbi:PREDICTED: general transcription factor 3C polypeptide 1 [Polistes dominula]|uniref:General transcription factor 3C polypeptide 1 n=1 Tax=Polistes dominula TaxID=743375 RepID=A0ABM1J8V4_POLDO|nr:PREDICTED: general transcription factor 3C polypeptide 1 [Polistes dominula]